MSKDLPEEFIAENDLVLEFARQGLLIGVSGIPDAGFAHEAESCLMNYHRFLTLRVRAKEDRCSENALESSYETSVLGSALLHPKGVQHFSCAAKPNYPVLLTNGERRQKDRNDPILAPRKAVRRMSGHLKQKMSIPPFVQELSRLRTFYGQSAQYEWTGGEPEILLRLLALQADTGDGVGAPQLLL
jgi:hypothetical protein